MRGSIWPFQFGSPRDIEQAEAKTTKDQTIQKRTEPAFIAPMQCKAVATLPTDEKWTFKIKFDGYRCMAVKRGREVTLFSSPSEVLSKPFHGIVETLACSRATSFSMVAAGTIGASSRGSAPIRSGRCRRKTNRFYLRTRRAIGRMDQASHEHGARVALDFDALLVGVYENKKLIFVAKVKDGFVPRSRDEILPSSQEA
jgi:hypothetical protein